MDGACRLRLSSLTSTLTPTFTSAAVVVVSVIAILASADKLKPESKLTNQCLSQNGVSFVSLYCGIGKVIRVQRASYGAHRDFSAECGWREGDCQVTARRLYDWSRCEARHSCVQLVHSAANMAPCAGLRPTYIQVHYICVDGIATSNIPLQSVKPAVPPVTPLSTRDHSTRPALVSSTQADMEIKAANICLNKTLRLPEIYIQSPGFPHFYPSGLDCRCDVRAPASNSIIVAFKQVRLASSSSSVSSRVSTSHSKAYGGRLCDDWLMLESPQFNAAGVVVCSDTATGSRSIQSRSSHIVLHFHSERNPFVKDLRGFQIKVRASRSGLLDIDCYKTTAEVALHSIPAGSASDPKRPYALPPTNFEAAASVANSAAKRESFGRLITAIASLFISSLIWIKAAPVS